MMGFLLVSQHRKASCSCSSTGVELFPLAAGGVASASAAGPGGGQAARGHMRGRRAAGGGRGLLLESAGAVCSEGASVYE